MTTEYSNLNRGVLFVNDRKEPGSNKPDRTGTLNVDGVEYFLDGWIKKSQAGASFLSVSVKRKDKQPVGNQPAQAPRQQPARPAATQQASGYGDGYDEDPPF